MNTLHRLGKKWIFTVKALSVDVVLDVKSVQKTKILTHTDSYYNVE